MNSPPRSWTRKRGSILLLALFFMFTLFLMSVAFFKLLPVELHSASRSSRDMKAHYVANGAVNNAIEWLGLQAGVMDQSMLDSNYNTTYNPSAPITIDGDWAWTTRIDVNPTGGGLYDITSRAYWRSKPYREVRATVQQDTFAKYALFIDRWPSGNSDPRNDLIFTLGDAGIQGPFHTNDFFNLKAPTSSYFTSTGIPWASGSQARLTYVRSMPDSQSTLDPGIGDGQRWYGGNYMGDTDSATPFDNLDGSPNTGAYARLVEGGRERLNRVEHINLPPDQANLRALSWRNNEDQTGQSSTTLGINVNTTAGPNAPGGTVEGGIYIDGNAEKLILEITQNDNQQIRVRGREDYWRRWNSNLSMVDDWDCVPNGTYSQGSEILEPYTCDLWGIVDWTLPDGNNGLTSPEPVYGWIPDADTCYRSYSPPRYNPDVENCTWTLICSACVPQGGWEYSDTDPGAGWQHRTRTEDHDSFVIEVNNAGDPTTLDAVGTAGGYTIPAGERVNGTDTTSSTDVAVGKTIVKKYNETDGVYEWSILDGSTNGVVFVDGHINNLQGINKGARYTNDRGVDDFHGRVIATDTGNGRDVRIKEDILQYYDGSDTSLEDPDHPNALLRGEISPDPRHILGVIAEDMWIDTPNRPGTHFSPTGSSGDGSLDLYGIFMAGRTRVDGSGNPVRDSNGRPIVYGGFGVVNGDTQNGDGEGLLRLFGGIIGANGRKTYKTYGSGSPQGYGLQLNYDDIAAQNLENFPTYNSYTLVRYTERHVD